ncbi:MAG TPA: DUF4149 domain-containing protein [Blastocatellia bacterium]|jgi:hypothetical protein|nr:DUF4149 domain-containing protein [Blastocatellia bacterium]
MAVDTTTHKATERVAAAGSGVGYQLLAFVEVLLLGVWLGAMGFFSFAVPQSGFAVLPSRELVGLLVTSTITKVEILGLVIGGLLTVIQLVSWRARGGARSVRLILIGMMVVAAALSHFWITPEMVRLREAMGPALEHVPLTDPLKIQFNHLHGYSVGLLMAAMLGGVLTLFLTVRSWLRG